VSVIASLDINIRGSTAGLEKATAAGSANLERFKKSVDMHASAVEGRFAGMSSKLTSLFSGMGSSLALATSGIGALAAAAAAGGAAFFGMGMKAMEGLAKLGETAEKIGISTEALAGLQHAASLAGSDADTLNTSLVKMQRNLSEAANGGGSAAKALGQLGINAADLKGLNADESFLRIADGIMKVGDQSDRVALAMDIFGKSGAGMLNMMADGADGLKAAMKEAAEIGLSVSDSQAAQAKAADDAITTMKSSFVGFARTAAITIAPFVKMVADGMTEAMKWVNSLRDRLLNFAYTVEFVWKNFSEYADLYLQKAGLAVVQFYNSTEHLVVSLPQVFKAAFESISATIEHSLDVAIVKMAEFAQKATGFWGAAFIAGSPALSNLVGTVDDLKRRAEASGRALEQMQAIGDRLKGVMTRPEGDFEAALRQSAERLERAIEARKKAFVAEKMNALKPKKKTGEEPEAVEGKHEHAAVERGSQEAFKIIAGQQGDKMLKTANEQLTEARKTNKLLDKLLSKPRGPGVARANI
jgi:hypothetical protein